MAYDLAARVGFRVAVRRPLRIAPWYHEEPKQAPCKIRGLERQLGYLRRRLDEELYDQYMPRGRGQNTTARQRAGQRMRAIHVAFKRCTPKEWAARRKLYDTRMRSAARLLTGNTALSAEEQALCDRLLAARFIEHVTLRPLVRDKK